MTDHRKDVQPITPAHVIKSNGDHITAAELMKIDRVPAQMMPGNPPTVIYVKEDQPPPEYRGDDLLRRFLPYFVITMMGLVMIGGISAILAMVIPPIMALIITLVGSLVSIILSLVATVIVAVIVAMGITMCQTINRRDELAARRMDQE